MRRSCGREMYVYVVIHHIIKLKNKNDMLTTIKKYLTLATAFVIIDLIINFIDHIP